MNTNTLGDFQICITVPLKKRKAEGCNLLAGLYLIGTS